MDDWILDTVKQVNMKGEIEYFMYLRVYNDETFFLVKEINTNKVNPIIIDTDLIYFSSENIPIIVYLGKSSKSNIIFTKKIKGLVKIEEQMNKYLTNHPIELVQEMDFIQFKQRTLSFKHMGIFYSSNQDHLNYELKDLMTDEVRYPIEFFTFSTDPELMMSQIRRLALKTRMDIESLVESFILPLTPNNSYEDFSNPNTDALKRILKFTEEYNIILNDIFPIGGFLGERKKFLLRNLMITKETINIGLKKFITTGETNMFLNPYIFRSPKVYFPTQSVVKVKDFVDVYLQVLLDSLLPFDQIEIIEGSYIDQVIKGFEKLSELYKKTLHDINSEYKEEFPINFKKALDVFVKKINNLTYFVPKRTKAKLNKGLTDYLLAMFLNPKYKNLNLFKSNGNEIFISAISSVYHNFGIIRLSRDGFAQKVEVFFDNKENEDSNETKKKNNNEDDEDDTLV